MKYYTLDEVKYLIGYYEMLVIGNPIGGFAKYDNIVKIYPDGEGERWQVRVSHMQNPKQYSREITEVAKELGLMSPDEVLKTRLSHG